MPCVGPGDLGEECCGRPVFRSGMCLAHTKQRQRGQALRPIKEKVSPFERVILAGNVLVDAESEDEYRRARASLRSAAEAWLRDEGWTPPLRVEGARVPQSEHEPVRVAG